MLVAPLTVSCLLPTLLEVICASATCWTYRRMTTRVRVRSSLSTVHVILGWLPTCWLPLAHSLELLPITRGPSSARMHSYRGDYSSSCLASGSTKLCTPPSSAPELWVRTLPSVTGAPAVALRPVLARLGNLRLLIGLHDSETLPGSVFYSFLEYLSRFMDWLESQCFATIPVCHPSKNARDLLRGTRNLSS